MRHSTASGLRSAVGRLPLLALGVAVLLAGCFRGSPSERPPIHLNPNMDNQPKYLPQAESAFFADGATMRPPVPGTVARGELREDQAYFRGMVGETPVSAIPMEGGDRILRRGEERYDIFCGPCHGQQGDGKGMLFVRSQVESADLTDARIVEMPSGQLYDVITRGFGLMSGYAHQIPVEDRWAIVAHVRALQEVEPVFGSADAGVEGELSPSATAEGSPDDEPAPEEAG